MPNQNDVRLYLDDEPQKAFSDRFLQQFSGVDANTHAEALRGLVQAERRSDDLEKEVEDIKKFYQAKLDELKA